MYSFSRYSERRLATCHPEIVATMRIAIQLMDLRVLEGARSRFRQNELYNEGVSKVRWPNSMHNTRPLSLAIDIVPHPLDYDDERPWYYMGGLIRGIAHMRGFPLRWGGDWDSDGNVRQRWNDLAHFEADF